MILKRSTTVVAIILVLISASCSRIFNPATQARESQATALLTDVLLEVRQSGMIAERFSDEKSSGENGITADVCHERQRACNQPNQSRGPAGEMASVRIPERSILLKGKSLHPD